jgi:hypothetical protein
VSFDFVPTPWGINLQIFSQGFVSQPGQYLSLRRILQNGQMSLGGRIGEDDLLMFIQ